MKYSKVYFVSNHPSLLLDANAGYATHMRETINGFRNEGLSVEILVNGQASLLSQSNKSQKINLFKLSSKFLKGFFGPYFWTSLKDLHLIIADFKLYFTNRYSIQRTHIENSFIYERASPLQISGVLFAKHKRIFHVLEINSPLAEEHRFFQKSSHSLLGFYYTLSERIQLSRSNLLVFVSKALADYYQEKFPILKDKILVLPNAVNPNLINQSFPQNSLKSLLQDFSLPCNSLFIGFVGSIFPWHGVDLLIESFHSIINEIPENVILLIVGDGEILSSLKVKAFELGISSRVIFTGPVEHQKVLSLIKLMEICVMVKSNWYGSPIKIFEYGLFEKAVIAPNTGPVNEVMVNKVDAILVNPLISEIAQAILDLLNDEEYRLKIAYNWHIKVLDKHIWTRNCNSIINRALDD